MRGAESSGARETPASGACGCAEQECEVAAHDGLRRDAFRAAEDTPCETEAAITGIATLGSAEEAAARRFLVLDTPGRASWAVGSKQAAR